MRPAESPMVMQAESIRGTMEGRKTKTRRIVTAANTLWDGHPMPRDVWPQLELSSAWVDPGPSPAGNLGPYLKARRHVDGDELVHRLYCRTQPGDLLWVRETWSPDHRNVYPCIPVVYRADRTAPKPDEYREHVRGCRYEESGLPHAECLKCAGFRWRSPRFMPKSAVRLWLKVEAVGVERLQDLTEEDAVAEGVRRWSGGRWKCFEQDALAHETPIAAFECGWDKINGHRPGCSWSDDPWVWVLTYRMLEPSEVQAEREAACTR